MGNRRLALLHSSDDDEEDNTPPPPQKRKRKKLHIENTDEEEEEEKEKEKLKKKKKKKKNNKNRKEESSSSSSSSSSEDLESHSENEELEAQPLGDAVSVTGKGRWKRNHYASFEYDGTQYQLEDPVLLFPENGTQKPYVAIIKDIAQTREGATMVTGQWFYRPEEAEKRGGGNWQSQDTRELFYSFHRDEVPAESVMHKCVVHFIPLNKQIPYRKQHPGFIVQKVYDTEQRRLFKLTDKDYEDNKQHEIDLLVQKTLARIGDLPDIEPEDTVIDHEDQMKNKRLLRKRNMPPLEVSRKEGLSRSQSFKTETPGSTTALGSEFYAILSNFKLLTGETQRDKWLEKLFQSIQFVCAPVGNKKNGEEEWGGSDARSPSNNNGGSNHLTELPDSTAGGNVAFDWPDAAVPAVAALEKAAHEALSADFQKYNQKMRQLTFNIKSNAVLARRLLNGELEPLQILSMSPTELKEGLTAEEIASRKPEESGHLQMTDARCKRCSEKQVGLIDIIQAGHGDRYQLECVACGNTWYASRDDAATLTIEGPSSTSANTTAKFEDVEKNLDGSASASAEKGASDVLNKTTEVPVLDNQKSFNKTGAEENPQ